MNPYEDLDYNDIIPMIINCKEHRDWSRLIIIYQSVNVRVLLLLCNTEKYHPICVLPFFEFTQFLQIKRLTWVEWKIFLKEIKLNSNTVLENLTFLISSIVKRKPNLLLDFPKEIYTKEWNSLIREFLHLLPTDLTLLLLSRLE